MKRSGRGTERYEKPCEKFHIDIPGYDTFGFDVIDARARRIATGLPWSGSARQVKRKKYSFPDLANLPNKAASILLTYNINRATA